MKPRRVSCLAMQKMTTIDLIPTNRNSNRVSLNLYSGLCNKNKGILELVLAGDCMLHWRRKKLQISFEKSGRLEGASFRLIPNTLRNIPLNCSRVLPSIHISNGFLVSDTEIDDPPAAFSVRVITLPLTPPPVELEYVKAFGDFTIFNINTFNLRYRLYIGRG